MGKRLCVIHANCQGEALADLFRLHPRIGAEYDVRHYVNYLREPVPEADLRACDIFLYQWLGEQWGELASETLLARLGPRARALCVPNLLFKGYWPFWCNIPEGFEWGDSFVNRLLARGHTDAEIGHIVLRTDLARYYDLDKLLAETVAVEREKEKRWDVKLVDRILERWRDEWLFATINHPRKSLLVRIAVELAALLGFEPFPQSVLDDFPEFYPELELPINPWVARHHKLAFLPDEPAFRIYDRPRTYAQYLACYLRARREGATDFVDWLGKNC